MILSSSSISGAPVSALDTRGSVYADFLDSAASVLQPSLYGVATLTADVLDSAAAIHQPDLFGIGTIIPDLANSTAAIYQPTFGAGPAPLTVNFVDSAATIFDPSVEETWKRITRDSSIWTEI